MNGLGVMKLSQGVDGQTPGKLKIHNPELRSGEDISLVFIKDKLILRSSEATPYRVVDPETLEEKEYKEEEEDEEEDEEQRKEKKNKKTLKWEANEDTGRSLTFSPLFTDGQFLYVISKLKVPKLNGKSCLLTISEDDLKDLEEDEKAKIRKEHEEKEQEKPKLAVEKFDPENDFKFVS